MKNNTKKTYFVTGGGTGGHVYPAIAIAKELRNDPSTQKVYYVGNPNNLEAKIAQEEGFEFLPVDITSMPRKINFDFLKWGFKLDKATWKALFYIFKYKPDAVFGTGGYVSAPAIMGAILSKTPYMIHDSDAHPGIVSRYVSKYAKKISLAFEDAKKYIDNPNIEIFGNPIKQEFFSITKEEARKELNLDKKLTLLVMGGSQGAMNINHTTANCLKYFVEKLKINVILQTGAKNYDSTIDHIIKIFPDYSKSSSIIVRPYFNNMAIPLRAADIAISRSGSLSLSEIAAVEIPSILVPFPYAAADHQRINARCCENAGASIYIDDFELCKATLEKAITELVNSPEKLADMAKAAKKLSKPYAAKQITEALKKIAE